MKDTVLEVIEYDLAWGEIRVPLAEPLEPGRARRRWTDSFRPPSWERRSTARGDRSGLGPPPPCARSFAFPMPLRRRPCLLTCFMHSRALWVLRSPPTTRATCAVVITSTGADRARYPPGQGGTQTMRYKANRGGHAPGHLRDWFEQYLDEGAADQGRSAGGNRRAHHPSQVVAPGQVDRGVAPGPTVGIPLRDIMPSGMRSRSRTSSTANASPMGAPCAS